MSTISEMINERYPYKGQLCQNPDGSRGGLDANESERQAAHFGVELGEGAFAEWIRDNEYVFISFKKLWYNATNDDRGVTTPELFQIFQTISKQN